MANIAIVYLDIRTGVYKGAHHGLAWLGAHLKQQGHGFHVAHVTSPDDAASVKRMLAEWEPTLLGLSATSNQFHFAAGFLDAVRPPNKIPVIIGGNHATLAPSEVMHDTRYDFACIGEGEIPLLELVRRLDSGGDTAAVPGIWARRADGTIARNGPPPLIEPLDAMAFPDYGLFDVDRLLESEGGRIFLNLSRGCPYDCSFCCNHAIRKVYPNGERYVRWLSVPRAIGLIKHLQARHAVREIFFEDDILGLNSEWTLEFCRCYAEEIRLPFSCNLRIEAIRGPVAEALRRAGLQSVNIGIESGSEEMRRKYLNKNFSNEEVIERVALLHRLGISIFAYNIIGLPFETEAMVRETISLNLRADVDAGVVFFFYPYPGTRLYDLCLEKNLIDPSGAISSYTKGPALLKTEVPRRRLMRLYYRFRWLLYRRRFMSSVTMNRFLKRIAMTAAGAFFACFPGAISLLIREGGIKSAVKRLAALRKPS